MVKVCSQIQPDYELILQAIVCLVFVSIGMHTFCYWIYQHKKKNVAKIWKKSWSFAFISLIMVLFVVGMVATGFAAQMNWLSKEKMYRSFHVHHEKVKHLQGYTLTDILLNLRRNKLSLFSRSRDVDVYDYLCVISPEHNLQAIIRFTLPNVQLEPQELFTYVVLKKEDQLEEFQYRKLSVGEIVQSLEKGIIPKE